MIKFIIEVSEEYIRQNADVENVTKKAEGENANPLKALFDAIAYSAIEKKIDKGVNEFVISQDNFDDGDKKLFDHCFGEVCMLAFKTEKEEEADK